MKKRVFLSIGVLALTTFILFNISLNCQSAEEKQDAKAQSFYRQFIGFYSGWSFGGGGFKNLQFGKYSAYENIKSTPSLHFGLFAQYNVSNRVGFQFELNFQMINSDIITYTDYWYSRRKVTKKKLNMISYLNINGIFSSKKFKKTQFYLLLGFGLNMGGFLEDVDNHYNIKIGYGGRSYLFNATPNLCLNYGLFFRLLPSPNDCGNGSYFFTQIGLEYHSIYKGKQVH